MKIDTNCIDPEYYTLAFSGADTAASVERYAKGVNFATRIDSSYSNQLNDGSRALVKLHSYVNRDINTYDWKISLLPSGRVIKVTDITVAQREQKLPRKDTRRCVNNVSLVANGTMYNAEGQSDVTTSVSFDIN